ncbi:MAG: peptide chain release factor N(5)-glutamine methyltransferase, partial [Campylobacterales bacterium]|nr:peptide chain release factor N(5)-glutamine methyltransferase [Campylobacterales bacterium]
RASYEPLEYITNRVSFYSNEFFIDYGALIPRPETELLIDEVLKIAKDGDTIFEIGVGSGIISIMLALNLKNSNIFASDISLEALNVANKNIQNYNLENQIITMNTNLLDGFNQKIDILVSNPPYIKDSYKIDENLKYEPQNALFGGADGDEILKQIIVLAKQRCVKYLVCEMGYDQKESIKNFANSLDLFDIAFYKDYANFDRGFVIKI